MGTKTLTLHTKGVVGRQGIEPWTVGLKARCSAG